MRIALPFFLAAGTVLAGFDTWSPPGPYDVRAPCPMLSTLANHGFLPHSGKDINQDTFVNALFDALNMNNTLGNILWKTALFTNPNKNATTFSLNDLGNHNVLEHDASLSRPDAFHGNAVTFNQTVFDETKSYWTDEVLTVEMAAKARLARVNTSKATNPQFQLSELGETLGFGESAAYLVVLGDMHTGTANRSWVEWWFEHERLPLHLGWKRPAESFDEGTFDKYIDIMKGITQGLINGTDSTNPTKRCTSRSSRSAWSSRFH